MKQLDDGRGNYASGNPVPYDAGPRPATLPNGPLPANPGLWENLAVAAKAIGMMIKGTALLVFNLLLIAFILYLAYIVFKII
jgi:hypothetical protein